MANVGHMEDEAMKRKERLKAMRNKNKISTDDSEEPPEKLQKDEDGEKLPKPVFRSYQPKDENLKESILPKAQPVQIEEQVKDHLDAAKPQTLVDEVDLINLAPRKPDWDLKRDVAKKLEKLEKRTQKAIAELIRERLLLQKEDLAGAVNAVELNAEDED